MPIFRGTNNIKKIFRGNNEIVKVFRGTNLIFTSGLPQYEELADINVTTATTQIDFDNLNITKDDELRLVYTLVGESTTASLYSLFVNNNTTSTNYTSQNINVSGSTINPGRSSDSIFAAGRSTQKTYGFNKIKVSNNDKFVFENPQMFSIGSLSSELSVNNRNVVGHNFTLTSITKLSVVSSRTNGIAVGSRLQLYKVNTGVA